MTAKTDSEALMLLTPLSLAIPPHEAVTLISPQSLTTIFHDLILVIRDLVFVFCHVVLVLFLTFRVRCL